MQRDLLDIYRLIDCNLYFSRPDMEILNLSGLTRLFAGRPIRVCAVHLGLRKGAETFRSMTRGLGHITVFRVDGDEDLPKIVLGQAKRFLSESLALWGD